MAGVKGKSGGVRTGQGRPPKAEELKLIEKLTPLEGEAFRALKNGLENGEFPYVKLWFEYMHGKPKEKLDVTSDGEKIEQVFKVGDQIIRFT